MARWFSFGKAESSTTPELDPTKLPRHVAFIMDGNGRWAKERHLPRVEGHRAGAKTVRMIIEEARRAGIRYVTLFAFSSENWGRPQAEVATLMGLFAAHLESEVPLLLKHAIRLRAIGDRSALPEKVVASLERAEARTAAEQGMDLIIAVSYGARDEIAHAAKRIAAEVTEGRMALDEITANNFGRFLYAPDVPDPDLLIRTSNELRISNFLLWQLAYSEIVVSKLRWPEFSKEELYRCIGEYAGRSRRFGLTQEQVSNGASVAT